MERSTVIMPTTADTARAASLERAIASVTRLQDPPGIPLVIVNGPGPDPVVVSTLRRRRDIRLREVSAASYPEALSLGRRCVDTATFGFLDDDDVYRQGALRERAAGLLGHPTADVVVTRGLRRRGRQVRPVPRPAAFDAADMFASLFRSNWLPSCGGLYRTATVGESYFDPLVAHREWTFIAFRLAREKHVLPLVTARPHYLIGETPGSASKGDAYVLGGCAVYRKMLDSGLSASERALVRRRLAMELHLAAGVRMARGEWAAAWRSHLESLALPGGWQYALFSRKLIGGWLTKARSR